MAGVNPILIKEDGRCTCTASDLCPLGKVGSAPRCTEEELNMAGVETKHDNWAHRSKGMRCSSCMWFAPKPTMAVRVKNGEITRVGRCRRHAPTMSGYPVVYENDWCGDHKIDENPK